MKNIYRKTRPALVALLVLFPVFSAQYAHADFVVPPPSPATFESLQNLIVTITEASSTRLTDNGTFTVPTTTSIPLTFSIAHGPFWPSRTATSSIEDSLFTETLSENDLYMELWQGVPFTPDARMLQNWDITGSSTGQITATFPASGPYFLIAYFPDAFYRDPHAMCPNDDDWMIDCAPSYTLDQMRAYFNSSLTSTSSTPFPYLPDAFGGSQFTIIGNSLATTTPFIGSNVLFIPGTLTSRLYMKNLDGSERDLWEPRSDLDVPMLAMNTDGTSKQKIYTRDIVDQLYSNDSLYHSALSLALNKDIDVYGSFEAFMNSLITSHAINRWRAYPYDWRYDVRDIVANGTLVGTATTSPTRVYLQDIVQELASSSATGKVTIIAHSNGGLIAKALAIDLARKNKLRLIDRIILIGTPQYGTPKSIIDLLHGDEFTELGGLLMYSNTVRDAEATMPGAYDLIPSQAYFSHVANPVATFGTTRPAIRYRNAIGANITSFVQLKNFLDDTFHLDAGAGLSGSTKTPIPISKTLLAKAEATHAALDAWSPPPGVLVTAIAGWGQLTPYQENYTGTTGLTCDRTSFFVPVACSLLPQLQPSESLSGDGDDTVITKSAMGNVTDALYLDAKSLFEKTNESVVHSSLLAAEPIQASIKNIISNQQINSPYLVRTMPTGAQNPLTVISAHSPVNLLATDTAGNQTGTVGVPALPGIYFEKEDIPGSSVRVIGEEKYIYLPQNTAAHVAITGYANGFTTIDIGKIDAEGSSTITHEYPDIPTDSTTSELILLSADGSVDTTIPTANPSGSIGKSWKICKKILCTN
jgi:pimeloyl-ACP methyl ester carboxylesterase